MTLNNTSTVVDQWDGGYKIELSIGSDFGASGWSLDFAFPYHISAAYGVNLYQGADGNYTMTGQDGWANLSPGETINPILIVEDKEQSAQRQYPQVLQFFEQDSPSNNNIDLSYIYTPSEPVTSTEPIYTETPSEPVTSTEPSYTETPSEPVTNTEPSYTPTTNMIDVDRDYGGDLASAIAAAQSGDLVQLGNNTYYTSGLTIDKNIILDGQDNTVIDGGGTLNSIITLYQGASGATIQDLKITNGNNGITGHSAANLVLQNLQIYNIGKNDLTADGNQTGIVLDHADGLKLSNTSVYDVDRKGIGVGDTNGAEITNVNVQYVNLAAHHAQSHDTAGIKFFNTNNVLLKDSYFERINAFHIWNDTTNKTTLDNNNVVNVGTDFLAPSFNSNVTIAGIYNEKSANSTVRYNEGTAIGDFTAFKATAFTTQTMNYEDNNNFSKVEFGTQDYWVNQEAETLIAITENPDEANFSLFATEYYAQL